MDNYTYYKDEIEKITRAGDHVAVRKSNAELVSCRSSLIHCTECKFDWHEGCGDCTRSRRNWMNTEHVEEPALTRDENYFLSHLNSDYFIARDDSGELFIYPEKPIKTDFFSGMWDTTDGQWNKLTYFIPGYLKNDIHLDFIKFEDEGPWRIGDLLTLEVKN